MNPADYNAQISPVSSFSWMGDALALIEDFSPSQHEEDVCSSLFCSADLNVTQSLQNVCNDLPVGSSQLQNVDENVHMNKSAKPKKCGGRKGKWIPEEEAYTYKVIELFNTGLLKLDGNDHNTTLRSYLAEKLDCDPMRITKKFTGAACLGKRVYHFDQKNADAEAVQQGMETLNSLEKAFRDKLEQMNRKRNYNPASEQLEASQIVSTPAIDALVKRFRPNNNRNSSPVPVPPSPTNKSPQPGGNSFNHPKSVDLMPSLSIPIPCPVVPPEFPSSSARTTLPPQYGVIPWPSCSNHIAPPIMGHNHSVQTHQPQLYSHMQFPPTGYSQPSLWSGPQISSASLGALMGRDEQTKVEHVSPSIITSGATVVANATSLGNNKTVSTTVENVPVKSCFASSQCSAKQDGKKKSVTFEEIKSMGEKTIILGQGIEVPAISFRNFLNQLQQLGNNEDLNDFFEGMQQSIAQAPKIPSPLKAASRLASKESAESLVQLVGM